MPLLRVEHYFDWGINNKLRELGGDEMFYFVSYTRPRLRLK